jgi:hypothetical protein
VELDGAEAQSLAIECWRIEQWLNRQPQEAGLAGVRYAVRRIKGILEQHGLEAMDLTGSEPSDGLAVEICDVVEDASLPAGSQVISETLSPVVLWRDQVVQHGRVVVRRGREPGNE